MVVAIPRPQRAARVVLAFVLILCGIGCGGGPPASAAATVAAASPSSAGAAPSESMGARSSAAGPTASSTAASTVATDDVFTSTVYPYTLTLPSDVVQVVWHPAERAWDGEEAIAVAAPFNDTNGLVDGGVFLLGTRWTGSLKAFMSTVVQNVARYHECRAPDQVRPVAVGGAAGTAWSHRCVDIFVVRIATVHGGWGLVAFEQVLPDHEAGAVDRLADWIGTGLKWRSS